MIVENNSSMRKNIDMRNNLERNDNKKIVNNDNKFDEVQYDAFNNGTQFFNMGGKLENASTDLKQNKDFINGYNRAQRINNIRNNGNDRKMRGGKIG